MKILVVVFLTILSVTAQNGRVSVENRVPVLVTVSVTDGREMPAVAGSLAGGKGWLPNFLGISREVPAGKPCPTEFAHEGAIVRFWLFQESNNLIAAPICAAKEDGIVFQTPLVVPDLYNSWTELWKNGILVSAFGGTVRVVSSAPAFDQTGQRSELELRDVKEIGEWVYLSVSGAGLGSAEDPADLGMPTTSPSALLADVSLSAVVEGGTPEDVRIQYAASEVGTVGRQVVRIAVRKSLARSKVTLRVGDVATEFYPLPRERSR